MKELRIDGRELPPMGSTAMRSANPPAFRLDVVRSVRQHRPLAAGVFAATFAAVMLFALSRKPMYKAESLTYVEPLATRALDDGTPGVFDPSRYESYLQQQIQTAERPDILEQAIASLPPGTWQQPGEDIHAAAARLAAMLKVQRVGQSYQLSISLEEGNPRQAAAVVNAATTTFLQQGRHDETVRQDGRLQLLIEEKTRIQSELDADHKEQAQLGAQLGMADPATPNTNPYDSQLTSIRSELVSARQAHDIAAAQLASIASRKDPSGAQAAAEDTITSDASVTALKQTITQRRAQLANQMASLTPANPVYKQDQQEIAQLDKQLEGRVAELRNTAERRLEDRLRLDLERTGDVEARLNAQLAQQKSLAHTAAPRLQRASELAADITRLENRYTAVDSAISGLSLDANGPGTAHLAVAASVPVKPEPSKRILLFAMALPLGLLAGIGAAVFARKRDPHLYTEGDVEEQLGFLPMVAMPALDEVSGIAAEEYLLRVAAAIERAYRIGQARVFVFTQASPSTEIANLVHGLRLKLIGLGFKTLALAADEALLGDAAEAAGIHASRKLAAESNGRQEGYASANLDRLKSGYDIVLLEARPLLHSAEAEYAARTADATILVVESSVTTQLELRQCAQLLERLRAEGVGVALVGVHRNAVGAEMRASIADAERRRPAHVTPSSAAEPRVLEERVYGIMQRRVQREFPDAVAETPRNVGMVERESSPGEERAGYVDRPSASMYAGEGMPVVESVAEAPVTVVAAREVRSPLTATPTREVPMRDETAPLRQSLAQVEFSENNVADDLPDGAPLRRSFFRFFERRPQEITATREEIGEAFDRVVQRPAPPSSPRAGEPPAAEPVAPAISFRGANDEDEPPVVIHAAATPAVATPAPVLTALAPASSAIDQPVVRDLELKTEFPHPEAEPFEPVHREGPFVVAAALEGDEPHQAMGEFREIAPERTVQDKLRAEHLPGHATEPNPAGSLFVLREELQKDHSLMPRPFLPSNDSPSTDSRISERLFAATQLPARPEPVRAPIAPEPAPIAPEPVRVAPEPLAASEPEREVVSAPGELDEQHPDWLTSAEAERIRQLLAKFSEGVAKSQPQPPAEPHWFGQRRGDEAAASEAIAAPAPVAAAQEMTPRYTDLMAAFQQEESASVEAPEVREAVSHSELHFGVSPMAAEEETPVWSWPSSAVVASEPVAAEAAWHEVTSQEAVPPVAAAPEAVVAEPELPEPAFTMPAFAEAEIHAAAEPVEEIAEEEAPAVQWPSWPLVSRPGVAEDSGHRVEAKANERPLSRAWYEAFEEHFVAEGQEDREREPGTAVVHGASSFGSSFASGAMAAFAAGPQAHGDAEHRLTAAETLPLASYAPLLESEPATEAAKAAVVEPVPAAVEPVAVAPAMVEPVAIEPVTADPAVQPVIEAVTTSPSHAVLPTNPISTLYASHAAQPVSRASAEAVLARTLQQPVTQVSTDAAAIYFREAYKMRPAPVEPVEETLSFSQSHGNGNGAQAVPAVANGNGNGHGAGYEGLVASTPYAPFETELEFEPPVPWKTRKPPISAAATEPELTPQPGRWHMLRKFDPQSANGNGAHGDDAASRDAARESAAG